MTTLDCTQCGQRYHGQSIGYKCRKCGGDTREPCREKKQLDRKRFHERRQQCESCDCFGPVVINGNTLQGCNRLAKPCGVEQLWFVDRDDWCPASGRVWEPIDINAFTTTRPTTDDFAIVTTHFNPCRYNRLRDTYHEWLPSIEPVRDRLRVYELVLDDDEPEIEGSIVVRGTRENHFVWQKEPLLNRALRDIDAKYFAWVDHDLLFANSGWLADGIDRLRDGAVACQLFSRLSLTDMERRRIQSRPSAVASEGKGPPGGAWITETEFLRSIGGFETSNLFGGGDQTFFDALTGVPSWHLTQYSQAMRQHLTKWIEQTHEHTQGKPIACVDGEALHLWHGDRKNRQYATRYEVLTKEQFDPQRDLIINSNGLIEWVEPSTQLASSVKQFFERRREDSAESQA